MAASISRRAGAVPPPLRRHDTRRYPIALAAALLAILLRWCLDPVLGHVAIYTTVYIAVAYCAVRCGWGPATVCAVLGFGGIFYWFVDPRHSVWIDRTQVHGVIGFLLVSAVLIWLGEANRRKQLRLNDLVIKLTDETLERKRAEAELQQAHDELERRVERRTEQLSQALKELETEVEVRKEAEDRLRGLSVRLMTLQDEERRRIARDLHDSTGQIFAAMKMTLAALQRASARLPEALRLLEDLEAFTDQASKDIRTTSYLLHPPLLDEAGIASATRWFVDGFAKRSGIEVRCDVPDNIRRPNRQAELVLFRVLQESLTNVHRYSGATMAAVRLWLEEAHLKFEVADNGRGIPAARLKEVNKRGGSTGVGIAGMRERVRELGGQLELRSGTGGTTISVALPMPGESSSSLHLYSEAEAS